MFFLRKKCRNILEASSNSKIKAILYIASALFGTKDSRLAFGPFYFLFRMRNKKKYHELVKFRNLYKDKRCFIIGTGPSLTLNDLEKLENEITFGTNTLLKIYSKTNWRAMYYCIIDPNTYQNLEEELIEQKIDSLFYPNNRILDIKIDGSCFALNHSNIYKKYLPQLFKFTKFSDNIEKQVYDGASVIYATIQIAAYMGIKEIFLLGVDCNYSTKNTQHAEGMAYSNYSYKWSEDTSLTMIEGFRIAREYADANGIKIYNASRGGMLEVFPRIDLDEVLSND